MASSIGRWRLLFVIALGVLYLSVFISVCSTFQSLQKEGNRDYPFGIFVTPGGGLFVQDFSYNMLFLRGIHDRLVARPYQIEGQAEMAHLILSGSGAGLPHGYSPVAFVLTLPLKWVSNFQAYLVYDILTAGGILALAYYYLLPNVTQPLQIATLAVALPSVCTLTALAIGQTAMLTTILLGLFWILLQRRPSTSIGIDLALAILFWAICFKPNIAFVPFILLVGTQSWRALAFGTGLLLATWTLVSGYYGGWWTGLRDYIYLIDHYNHRLISGFVQGDERSPWMFALRRDALLACGAALIILYAMKRISLSEFFQLLVWAFVLFSPYLLASEYWILCLLIVEGPFFASTNWFTATVKWMLMAIIFNVRANIGFTDSLALPAGSILAIWLIVEIIRSRSSGAGSAQKGSSVLLAASV